MINKVRKGVKKKMDKIIFDDRPTARQIDANGYMHVTMTPISKAVVNPYLGREIPGWEGFKLKPDAIYYGLRDPDELRKAAPTFNGVPLLINHHEESAANPQKEWRVGSTGTDTTFDGEYLRSTLSITDKEAIDLIESGKMKELSCAYYFRPDFTSGTFHGVPFDFIMRDIKGNHVALVEEGRAGHDVKVADSKEGVKDMARKMTKDADPRIEALEVETANFLKAVNAIEAQKEGISPVDVGLDIDPAASVEEIVDTFMPGLDEEKRTSYIAALSALKGGTEDAEPEQCGDDEDDRFKDPAFKAGFEEGVRYGEKREKADPERIDRDHEREGEERYLKMSNDTIAQVKEAARREVFAHVKELADAANDCRCVLGNVNALAFDSAEDIYAMALKQKGIALDGFDKSAYKAMFSVLRSAGGVTQPRAPRAVEDDDVPDILKKYIG